MYIFNFMDQGEGVQSSHGLRHDWGNIFCAYLFDLPRYNLALHESKS